MGKAQNILDKKLKNGKISQEDYDSLSGFLGSEDRFNNTGVARAIKNNNFDNAVSRANTATDIYSNTAGEQDQAIRDSIQASYNKGGGAKTGQMMYDMYRTQNPMEESTEGTDEQTQEDNSGGEQQEQNNSNNQQNNQQQENELPDNVNKDITEGAAQSSADMVNKGNDFLDSGNDLSDKAQDTYENSYDPTLSDAFLGDLDNAYNKRAGYIDEIYGIDPENPGAKGEQFLKARDNIINDRLNSGLFDSDITASYLSDLDQNYKQDKADAMNNAFETTRGEKLGERTDLRNLGQNYGNALFGVAGADKSLGANMMSQGIQGLLNSGQLNLQNLGFMQNLIESNYGNEQNARMQYWDMLQGDKYFNKYYKPMLNSYKKSMNQGQSSPGFWSSFFGGMFG